MDAPLFRLQLPEMNGICQRDRLQNSKQTPFQQKWITHKFRGPDIRYEISINLTKAWIFGTHRLYPSGSHSYIKIFWYSMKHALLDNEKSSRIIPTEI